jgi:hypothetical protein
MKRGAPLNRKKPMNRGKSKKANHDYIVDNGFVSESTLQPLPKLPPIPKRKASRPKTTKARQEAKGRECTIRVPGYCPNNPETVVLCHYRLSGTSGIGMKPHDAQAAFGDDVCHAIVDGRMKTEFSQTEIRLMHAEGVFRTQAILRSEQEL